MKQKEAQNIASKIMSNSRKKTRPCLFPGCTDQSIYSHLLQKNGILNSITENSHVIEFYTNHQTNESKLKLTGRNDAFTFQGYCKNHDSDIFKPIEQEKIDFDSDQNNLLFTFRTIYNELRKKTISNEGFQNVLASKTLDGYVNKKRMSEFLESNVLGERDLAHFLNIAHEDYLNGTKRYKFQKFKLPHIPLCLSASITTETDSELVKMKFYNPKKFKEEFLNPLVINFFPIEKENILLLAYPTENNDNVEEYISNAIAPMEKDTSFKYLNDLIISRTETWACSPSFYSKFLKPIEVKVVKYSRDAMFNNNTVPADFNMFEGFVKTLTSVIP